MINPLDWLPTFLGVAGGTALATKRVRNSQKNEAEAFPTPMPAPKDRKEVIFNNINDLLGKTHVRFTPISVILTDDKGRTVYTLPLEELSEKDMNAYLNRNVKYFQTLFGKRALMSVQAAELAFTKDLLTNFSNPGGFDASKLAEVDYGFDKTHIPLDVYRENDKCASIFSLFSPAKKAELGFGGLPLEVRYTPDAVIFFSGETTLGYIPYAQMGEKTRTEFRAKNNYYFRDLFRNMLDDASAKFAAAFDPFHKIASVVSENTRSPLVFKRWLDKTVHEWFEFSPDVLAEVVAEEMGLSALSPQHESIMLALGALMNDDTYKEDPIVLEKILNAFGGNVVDFSIPQPIDNIRILTKGLFYLDKLTEGKLDLMDVCLQTLGDFLFSCGLCINPFDDMFVPEDNEFMKKYLAELWRPAVDDVEAVQQAIRLAIADPSSFEESIRKLSSEGKYLLKSCLGNYKAIRKVIPQEESQE